MKDPAPATVLALILSDYANLHAVPAELRHNGRLAVDATRVCAIAAQVRRLVECSCNVELTMRQETRLASLRKRADDLLRPYNLAMHNPYGLCFYAVPIGHDGGSDTGCVFLA